MYNQHPLTYPFFQGQQICLTKDQIDHLARAILAHVNKPFCIWLAGDLGAGKTALVREILYELGLQKKVPVTSPTFTLVNEYHIGLDWYAHLDLYRNKGSIIDLIGYGREKYSGIFVEWAEHGSDSHLQLQPDLRISIEYDDQDFDKRYYRLN